jgi:hypothetical protein
MAEVVARIEALDRSVIDDIVQRVLGGLLHQGTVRAILRGAYPDLPMN